MERLFILAIFYRIMEALEALRIIAATIFAFLPGFGLTLAIFPGQIDDRHPGVFRFFISLGVGTVILILTASFLGILGIFSLSWILVSLASLSAIFFAIWFLRVRSGM